MRQKLIHALFLLLLISGIPYFLSAHVNFFTKQHQQSNSQTAKLHSIKGSLAPHQTGKKLAESSIVPGLNLIKEKNDLSPNADQAAQPITICSGASIVIQGETPTILPDSYSWEVLQGANWVNAPGVNNTADYQPALLLNNSNTNVVFNIRRKIIIAESSGYDSYYDVTVQPSSPISNNTIVTPAISSFCIKGIPETIVGSVPSGGNSVFIYQWQSSTDNITFTDIPGAIGKDYAPPQLSVTTYYRRTVSAGSCVLLSPSNVVAIIILAPVTNNIVTTPVVNSFCVSGDPGVIAGNVPSGGNGTYTYQWQSSTDNVTFTNISGATSKEFDPSIVTATTYYRRLAVSGSCTVPVYSNAVLISIIPAVVGNSITTPGINTFCLTGDATAITGNIPTGGNGIYAYQWQLSTNNVTFTDIAGAIAKDYDPPVLTATTYYRRLVTSGVCSTPLISNSVSINIVALPLVPVPDMAAVSVCPGNTATLAVKSPQAGIVYNWYDTPARTTLLYTGTAFVTLPITANKTFYIESSNGLCASSSLAVIQVSMLAQPLAPSVVSNQVNTCSGTVAILKVQSPQLGITYNWYSSSTGGSALATGADFTTPPLQVSITYYVEAGNVNGCVSANRTPVSVTVQPLPQVTVQGATICPGSSATLSAKADGANTTVYWYTTATGGSPVFDGNTYITPVLNSNTSYYAEAVNNTTGCVSALRQQVQVQMLRPLATPIVIVDGSTASSVTFKWSSVSGAVGYQVSTDNGQTYTNPSSGVSGLSHTVTGLQQNQSVTILVKAIGSSSCQVSENSVSVSGQATDQPTHPDNPDQPGQADLASSIYVANAFTPNGDGKNDIVYVHSESIRTMSFYVYDQWGELLFTSSNISSGWDGTYKGNRLPVGVYVYYLKATMSNGSQVSKKGTITLLR